MNSYDFGSTGCQYKLALNRPLSVEKTGEKAATAVSLSTGPNPCRSNAAIRFSLPANGKIRLSIHDLTGREVARLADKNVPAGYHIVNWNGRTQIGFALPSGIYLCKLETTGGMLTRKLVLEK
jgi:flagellar hook assembly protein FlgD